LEDVYLATAIVIATVAIARDAMDATAAIARDAMAAMAAIARDAMDVTGAIATVATAMDATVIAKSPSPCTFIWLPPDALNCKTTTHVLLANILEFALTMINSTPPKKGISQIFCKLKQFASVFQNYRRKKYSN